MKEQNVQPELEFFTLLNPNFGREEKKSPETKDSSNHSDTLSIAD
ncbi:hypothetical protein [Halobacillus litoralis]|nr:hypothetical protein [Halobacillus litoralis]